MLVKSTYLSRLQWFAGSLCLAVAVMATAAYAGNNFGRQSAVGGVSVNAEGVVQNSTVDALGELRNLRMQAQTGVPEGLDEQTELRKISLKRLSAEIQKHLDAGKELPDEIRFLGGLTRIRYIFVYPEQKDIVLAGPAEGWKVDAQGVVVGAKSGAPTLHLDDLLIALRSADQVARGAITVSIDPTQEGMARLQKWVKEQGGQIGANPNATIRSIEDALGPQTVSFGGVDPTTRLARILVAADYRMKRFAMGFEASPVKGMKSFLDMTTGAGDMFPRWWLTTNYNPLLKSEDGLAWELRGPGVKAMTEDSFFSATGVRQTTNKVNPVAQKWANDLTENYDALAAKAPIFTELRNVMDLAVVTALISKENLLDKSGLDLETLLSPTLKTIELNPARSIPTAASFVKKGQKYTISASGGVEIRPSSVLEKMETSAALQPLRNEAVAAETTWQWWWN